MTESIIDNPMQNYRRASHKGTAYVCYFYRNFKVEVADGKYYILTIIIIHQKIPSLPIFKT